MLIIISEWMEGEREEFFVTAAKWISIEVVVVV